MSFTQYFEISGNEKQYNYPLAFYLSLVSSLENAMMRSRSLCTVDNHSH